MMKCNLVTKMFMHYPINQSFKSLYDKYEIILISYKTKTEKGKKYLNRFVFPFFEFRGTT